MAASSTDSLQRRVVFAMSVFFFTFLLYILVVLVQLTPRAVVAQEVEQAV